METVRGNKKALPKDGIFRETGRGKWNIYFYIFLYQLVPPNLRSLIGPFPSTGEKVKFNMANQIQLPVSDVYSLPDKMERYDWSILLLSLVISVRPFVTVIVV